MINRVNHKLDTDDRVCFYEQEFYVLSNFSAFRVLYDGIDFDTAEHCYHYQKFNIPFAWLHKARSKIMLEIMQARSAHDAFKIAHANKYLVRDDWSDVKFDIMRNILTAKVSQHEYVYRKLLETGNRELVKDSWRDDVWGWGPNRDGMNMLGKLWMEIRRSISKQGGKHEC